MEDGLADINPSSGGEILREKEEEKRETTVVVEEGEDSEKGRGGLLDNLIHNLVSPLSSKAAGDVEVFEASENERSKRTKTEKDHVDGGGGGSGNGGLIKNVISNLFHPNETQAAADKEKKNEEEVVKNGKVKTEEEDSGGGGGGGIIDNIVSHLPASLLDDEAVPTSDEASILIHSIIHD
ncbi:hypothetical protein ACOSQ3_029728 [Xanthoceras sorbifolium]